jgi:hypothetical protein
MRTGVYELHFHNDLFTTADYVMISLGGASNMAELMIEIQLTDVDLNDGVRGGMTALPNAAADAAGGLVISDAGGLDIDATDTNVSSILTDTGTTIPATIATAQADLDTITGAAGALLDTTATSAQLVDDVWDEVLTGATHNVANSAGRRLRQIDAAFEVHNGTAQSGTSTTITLDAGASSTDDIYNGDRIVITEGLGAQEHGLIIDYDGGTKVATMSKAWVVTPDNTSVFEIVPADVDIETWNNTAVTGDGDWSELETNTDAILVDTGTTIPNTLGNPLGASISADTAAILTDTGTTIPALLPAALVGGKMDSNVGAISADTTAADRLEIVMDVTITGAAEAGTLSTTQMTTDLTEATDDHYIGRIVTWTSGVLTGQSSDITDYTGATGMLTYTAVTEAPTATDTFVIT